MPEGDSLHRAVARLQVLVGQQVEVETPQCYKVESVPDIVSEAPEAERFRVGDQSRAVGDALPDQRLVAGIGNIWKAEALWDARASPWRALADVSDDELGAVLQAAHRSMSASVQGTRPLRHVHRRAGRACRRCGSVIRSAPQGEHARTAYWCPRCQVGGNAPAS